MPIPRSLMAYIPFRQRVSQNADENHTLIRNVWHNEDGERARLYDSFVWHFKEIVLCMLLAYLLARVDKIQQFFTAFSLSIKARDYPLLMFTLIFVGNGFMIFWLCYTFWHKPYRINDKFLRKYVFGEQTLQGFEQFYEKAGSMWRVSAVAAWPLVLVGTSLSLAILRNNGFEQQILPDKYGIARMLTEYPLTVMLATSVTFMLLAAYFRPRLRRNASLSRRGKSLLVNGLILAAILTLLTMGLRFYPDYYSSNTWILYVVLTLLSLAPPLAVTFILYSFSECLIKEKAEREESDPKSAGRYDTAYQVLRYISYFLGVLFFILINSRNCTRTETFSDLAFPVAVLMFVCIAYYQFLDFLQYNMRSIRLYMLLGITFILMIFFGQRAHYRLKFNGKEAGCLQRANLEHFFLEWAKARFDEPGKDSLNNIVYLVAAEGGGSRAGAWTAAVLTELDAAINGRFQKQCFAISSVSGGSVGAAATLALWDNARIVKKPVTQIYNESKCGNYIGRIFKRNYVSTALAGIFFYDLLQQIPLVHLLYSGTASRSDRQQDEENDAVRLALKDALGDSRLISPNYLSETAFLKLYYKHERTDTVILPKLNLPLFFPNTCRVEDGKRGVVSPVKMKDTLKTGDPYLFKAAVDIIGSANKNDPTRSLSVGEAVSLSELFPYVNSTIFVDEKTGSFMDGGVFENLGLTTLREIETALVKFCNEPDSAYIAEICPDTAAQRQFFHFLQEELTFKIILIYNIDNHSFDDRNDYFKNESLQLINPITGLLQTPFSGHTDYIYHRTKAELGKESVIDFPLMQITPNDSGQIREEIIMSRWLSRYEMNVILKRAKFSVHEKMSSLKAN